MVFTDTSVVVLIAVGAHDELAFVIVFGEEC